MRVDRTRRTHARLAALPGVAKLRRPVTPNGSESFELYYVRSGPVSAHPLVIIPGGPGVASVAFKGIRRRAAAAGLDVMMVEHRGVGLSRRDDAGTDLPPEALSVDQVVDDMAAVLDDAGVDTAVIYGLSYGTYIAEGFGVRHPDRVHAMILDSPLLSRDDITDVRAAIRELLWDGTNPETAALAPKVHTLVESGVLTPLGGQVAAALYGMGGAGLLERHLDLLLRGRTRVWRQMIRIAKLMTRVAPYRNEPDLVARIAFRELNYGGEPDGLPLDPAIAMRDIGYRVMDFEAEPYDLPAELPNFSWPTVVLSGGRDLTTPPAVAEKIAALIPDTVLIRLPTMAHGALSTREPAALAIAVAVCRGELDGLADRASTLDALPAQMSQRLIPVVAGVAARIGAALPGLHRSPAN